MGGRIHVDREGGVCSALLFISQVVMNLSYLLKQGKSFQVVVNLLCTSLLCPNLLWELDQYFLEAD